MAPAESTRFDHSSSFPMIRDHKVPAGPRPANYSPTRYVHIHICTSTHLDLTSALLSPYISGQHLLQEDPCQRTAVEGRAVTPSDIDTAVAVRCRVASSLSWRLPLTSLGFLVSGTGAEKSPVPPNASTRSAPP